MPQARQLAEVVLAHGGSPALQGEALTILARSCHALQQFNEAYRYYQQARLLVLYFRSLLSEIGRSTVVGGVVAAAAGGCAYPALFSH